MGGLTVQGVYGFGEAPGSYRKGHTGGVSLAYLRPNYELRAMFDVANDPQGRYSELFRYSRELTIGGTMTVGKLKLLGGFQQLNAPDAAFEPSAYCAGTKTGLGGGAAGVAAPSARGCSAALSSSVR